MENFEALQSIDNFCKVLVKKPNKDAFRAGSGLGVAFSGETVGQKNISNRYFEKNPTTGTGLQPELEDPFVDVFEEEDHIRILVQCRCQEQQVTFHPAKDGIVICREECHRENSGPETCRDICRKLYLRTDGLQLENMLFIIAKCNNNNTLEAMIPKIKQ